MNVKEEFKKLIPALSNKEFEQLKQNIIDKGCLDTIKTWNNFIIDGHNRYNICNDNNIEFKTKELSFDNEQDVIIWIINNQLGRRNISDFVKYELIKEKEKVLLEKGRENKGANQYTPERILSIVDKTHNTRQELSNDLNWSTGKIAQAKIVHDKADEKTKEELRTGNKSIYEVYKEIKNVHVSNNSGNNEWYTPQKYIDKAIEVLGKIDLDPASNIKANEVIKAKRIYTLDDNGLDKKWKGNIWLNPPYAAELIIKFVDKLVEEYKKGNINQALVLVNNATDTQWFKKLFIISNMVCFTEGRIRFWRKEENKIGAPLQGQAIIYIGENEKQFLQSFKQVGQVVKVLKDE